jgi:hypothetical protein
MKKSTIQLLASLLVILGIQNNLSAQYCAAPAQACGVVISNINIIGQTTTLDNTTTSCVKYTYFSGVGTDVQAGNTYQGDITVQAGGQVSASVYIYIDWDQNGTLNNPGEMVYSGSAYTGGLNTAIPFSVAVPANALSGVTRMRIRTTNTGGTFTPCSNPPIGETEDYDITVSGVSAPLPPNCALNQVPADAATGVCLTSSLTWGPDGGGPAPTGYKVYFGTATAPALVSTQPGTTYTPASLAAITTYYYKIVPYNAQGDASGCVERSFTTTNLSANVTPQSANVCANTNLAVNGGGTGGTGTKTHTWTGSGATYLSAQNVPIPTFNHSAAGTYNLTYTVEDTKNCTATSSATITVDASTTVDVSIAITAGSNPSCIGANVEFTATPTNGGTAPSYDWRVNSTSVGTGATFASTTLADNDVVDVLMASNASCADVANKQSNVVTMSVSSSVVPDVTVAITDGTNPSCPGSNLEFTATPINGGTTPIYSWRVNGTAVGTGDLFSSTSLNAADVVDVVMTSSSGCASTPDATSTGTTIAHQTALTPSISIDIDFTPYCEGSALNFTATPTNEGSTPTYEWFVNSVSAGTGATFAAGAITNGDIVTCELISSEACVTSANATSNAYTVAGETPADPAVSFVATTGQNPSCAGEMIEFTATPVDGGQNPTYEWFLNSASVATGVSYGSASFADGDLVHCVLTSDYYCLNQTTGTSAIETMSIVGSVTPAIDVQITQGSTFICDGEEVIFEATETNGGSAPTYDWIVNAVPSSTGPIFTSSNLVDGDEIVCVLTSSNSCASPTNAASNTFVMEVNPIPATPMISRNDLTLTSSATNGNQWVLNSIDIPGATNQTLLVTENGDYTVRVTELNCTSEVSAVSPVGDLGLLSSEMNLQLLVSPNPSTGIFKLQLGNETSGTISVYNVLGAVVFIAPIASNTAEINLNHVENGLYILTVESAEGTGSLRLVKD